jgi:hypothetical protein
MQESAAILRKAISKFPNGRRPRDFQKSMRFIEKHEEFFDDLSNQFWKTQKGIEEILARNIKEHSDSFS